jgi:hypothetical protein
VFGEGNPARVGLLAGPQFSRIRSSLPAARSQTAAARQLSTVHDAPLDPVNVPVIGITLLYRSGFKKYRDSAIHPAGHCQTIIEWGSLR